MKKVWSCRRIGKWLLSINTNKIKGKLGSQGREKEGLQICAFCVCNNAYHMAKLCICLSVCRLECRNPLRPEEGVKPGSTHVCETPDIGAGSRNGS